MVSTWKGNDKCPNCGRTGSRKLICDNCGTVGCNQCLGGSPTAPCKKCRKKTLRHL